MGTAIRAYLRPVRAGQGRKAPENHTDLTGANLSGANVAGVSVRFVNAKMERS